MFSLVRVPFKLTIIRNFVSDPDSLIPDPDPDSWISDPDSLISNPDPNPAFNAEYRSQLKKYLEFFDQKLQFTYPQASMKDFQAAEEAFSPRKRTSSTSKHEIS